MSIAEACLTRAERVRLGALEATIEGAAKAFVAVGDALHEIRETRLYRDSHSTFEDYCQERWQMDRRHANRHIDAAMIVGSIDPDLAPTSVGVARALAPFRDDLEAMRAAMVMAVEIHGPQPTAAEVRDIVRLPPVVEMPNAPPAHDLRFELIEDAVATLRLMPAADKICWPVDEVGDVEAVGEALAWLHAWLPKAERSWRAHKALMRAAMRQERDAKRGLRAA